MIADFLYRAYINMLTLINGALPNARGFGPDYGPITTAAPAGVTQAFIDINYYADLAPLLGVFVLITATFGIFLIWKIIVFLLDAILEVVP